MVHEGSSPAPEAGPRDAQGTTDPGDVEGLGGRYLAGEAAASKEIGRWIASELRRRFGGLRADHADLEQAVHERLLGRLRAGSFRGGSLRSYVIGIVQYTAIDRLRQRYRDRELQETFTSPDASSPDPYRALERSHQRARLRRLLFDLPQHCKELWRMVFAERLSYGEIAGRLDVPPGTVKSRMWHCRQQAQKLWRRRGAPDPSGRAASHS